ncbi:MAG: GNAT family N-acetyltransferase, partial [Rhodoferax sp.]
RFDPLRARERFAAGFAPEHMRHIEVAGERVGFVTLRPDDDMPTARLRLEHLYLRPDAQGQQLGSRVMEWVKAQAQQRSVTLSALKQSDANRFYVRHGFVPVGESDFDIHYRWTSDKEVRA